MGFPQRDAKDLLVKCHRRCCICHKFSGVKMELLDLLRTRIIPQSAADHVADLLLRKGLLLRPGRQGEDQPHRQHKKSQRFPESHSTLPWLPWTEKSLLAHSTTNG